MTEIITDTLLKWAFNFRETELWHQLADSDLFAVRLPDGELGYCCVMGKGGTYHSLTLYVGTCGFNTYLNTITLMQDDWRRKMEAVTSFNCLSTDYVQARALRSAEHHRLRDYVQAHGITVRRNYGWPAFVRFSPGYPQYFFTDAADARLMELALRAAVAVAGKLSAGSAVNAGFKLDAPYATADGGRTIPLLLPNGDGSFDWSSTQTPSATPCMYPSPELSDQGLLADLRALPPDGTLECRVMYLPLALGSGRGCRPFYPEILLAIDDTDTMSLIRMTEKGDENPQLMLQALAAFMIDGLGRRARSIAVSDDRTASLLSRFCLTTGIMLARAKTLAGMDEAVETLCQRLGLL